MKRHLIILSLTLITLVAGAQDNSAISTKITVTQYVEKYSSLAVSEMYRSRIPASITLAQGILESGSGNSRLATQANNHFGIKCKATWRGKVMYEDDDAPQECFRKYESADDSYRDHSDFLMNGSRYAFLFDLEPTDYKSWAVGLKKAGYATNPQYAELLIAFIEKHELHKYDKKEPLVAEEKKLEEIKHENVISYGKEFKINGVKAMVSKPAESYVQIALDHDIKVWQVYKFNDLDKDAVCKSGDTIFLQNKKNKAEQEFYFIQNNESMYWISQRFAVKLEKLLERNHLQKGEEPAKGEQIYLQNKRKTQPKLQIVVAEKPIVKVQTEKLAEQDSGKFDNIVYSDPIQNINTQEPKEIISGTLDTSRVSKQSISFFHTVQAGETLYGISKKYNIGVDAIMFLNGLENFNIQPKMRLIINPNIPSVDTKDPQPAPGVHQVKPGETLFSISRIYAMSVGDVKAQNNLTNDTIYIGQQLIIVPVKETNKQTISENPELKTPQVQELYHVVEKGQTLYSISKKYNVSIDSIKELNFPLNDSLTIGQSIRIR